MPSKPWRFETQDQAIDFLRSNCPERLRERVQNFKQIVVENEEALEKLQQAELYSGTEFEGILAPVAAKLLDWKYGDYSTGMVSNLNPLLWRTARGGAIDFRTAVAEFGDLAQREPHRSVILAIPPGFETRKQKFDSFSDAIAFLRKDLDPVDQAQSAHELAEEQLLSAQRQLRTAKANVKEAEHAALAKGADGICYQWKWGDTANFWSKEQSPLSMINELEFWSSANKPRPVVIKVPWGEQPIDPLKWGLTVQQLFDLGTEVFGSPQDTFKAAMEIIRFGMGHYQQSPSQRKREPDGFGGWNYNDLEEMSDSAKINMYDVVQMITKPKTKGTGVSYAVLVNDGDPKENEVFVSHAWAEKFAYFVFVLCFDLFPASMFQRDDVENQSEMELNLAKAHWQKMLGIDRRPLSPTTVIWVCALCIDQHADIQGTLGGSVKDSPFAKVLSHAMTREMLVVYNPAIDLYDRVWCCYEIFLALQKQALDTSFKVNAIGMSARQVKDDFEDYFGGHDGNCFVQLRNSDVDDEQLTQTARPWVEEFCTQFPVDVRQTKASVEADRLMILDALGAQIPQVNELVNRLRQDMFMRLMPMIMDG